MHLLGAIGYTDYKVNDQGIPVQLVGDTYLPQGGITTNPTGKGWYEVYQNGIYVGYLKPGGKNGIFIAQGSPVIWPAAPAKVAPPTSPPVTVATTSTPPAPITNTGRSESVPTSPGTNTPITSLISPGGQSIIELPGNSTLPIEETPSNTAVDATMISKTPSWLVWSIVLGAGLFLLKRGSRGK